MKNFKFLYFLPAILFVSVFVTAFVRYGEIENFLNPIFLFNVVFMIAIGILMSRGNTVGAYLGIAFGTVWIVYDIVYHKITGYGRDVPLEIICIPLIIYYIYCAVAIKTKPIK